ncbi:hypothetical protein Tco_0409234 [Tanacetum coccineum]
MNPVAAKQVALDNALVPPEKRLKIEKCNARIEFSKPQREETYQVTLDALKLSTCYHALLITAEVPEVYMHQFWNTIQKIKDTDAYRLLNQDFVEPPSEEELVPFIQELDYSGKCDMLSAIHTDQMHQPWRTFVAIINREITLARKEHMPYPRFTKVIINHFISKDKTIYMKNMINLHTVRDDILLGTLKFVSKTQDYQQYGALILDEMINQDIKDSKAYKTYLDFATRKATPKKARKFKKVASPSRKLSPILEEEPVMNPKRAKRHAKKSTTMPTSSVVIRDTPSEFVPKKKTPAKVNRGKGMDLLSNVALLEAAQLKKTLKKSKLETHKLYESGSGDGVGSLPKVPDEQEDKTSDSDDVDVTKDDDDDDVKSDADGDKEASDSEKIDSDEDENPNLNQNDDEEEYEEEYHEEEGKGDVEMTDAGRDDSTQQTTYEQVKDDEHVILTIVHDTQKTEVPLQSSSVSSNFANQFLNLDNVLPTNTEVVSMMNVKVCHKEPSTQTPPLLNIPVTIFHPCLDSIKEFLPWKKNFLNSNELMITPIDFSAYVMNNLKIENLTQEYLVGPTFNILKGTCKCQVELEYHFKEYQGHQVVPAKYFINNDLEYLKEHKRHGSIAIESSEVAYDKYAMWGITHWGPQRQQFYGYARNKQSKHDVFSTKRIIAVTHVKDMKWYDYGFAASLSLEEALQSEKRCHLRLECGIADVYQMSDITNTTPYTAYNNPQGIIYLDKLKRNRLMHSDELYKFYDGTLTSVRRVLHDIASSLRMDYLPKRK